MRATRSRYETARSVSLSSMHTSARRLSGSSYTGSDGDGAAAGLEGDFLQQRCRLVATLVTQAVLDLSPCLGELGVAVEGIFVDVCVRLSETRAAPTTRLAVAAHPPASLRIVVVVLRVGAGVVSLGRGGGERRRGGVGGGGMYDGERGQRGIGQGPGQRRRRRPLAVGVVPCEELIACSRPTLGLAFGGRGGGHLVGGKGGHRHRRVLSLAGGWGGGFLVEDVEAGLGRDERRSGLVGGRAALDRLLDGLDARHRLVAVLARGLVVISTATTAQGNRPPRCQRVFKAGIAVGGVTGHGCETRGRGRVRGADWSGERSRGLGRGGCAGVGRLAAGDHRIEGKQVFVDGATEAQCERLTCRAAGT